MKKMRLSLFGRGADSFFSADLPGTGAGGKYETRSPLGERAYRIYPIFRARVPSGVSMRLMFAPRARSLPMMSS